MSIGVGLYGSNGHQIYHQVAENPDTHLAAVAAIGGERLDELRAKWPELIVCDSLPELLKIDDVQLVSLCSPRRADQAADALLALQAGRHVYAEKPCALNVQHLDVIVATAQRSGVYFHEMAGTAFEQPWLAMREIVRGGRLGTIVQVLAQKSYPMFDGRPQDENTDGGLTRQAGVHAYRWIEHVACSPIAEVTAALESQRGNADPNGNLRIASTSIMRLQSGAIATVIANYCNQPGLGSWGNEMLRIFGTKGFVEATDGGTRTRLVIGDDDLGPIDTSAPGCDYFDCFVDELMDRGGMPVSLAAELHPTRMVLLAKELAV